MIYSNIKYNDVVATVDAVSALSANAQLRWIVDNEKCFCLDCRMQYRESYGVIFAGDNYNTTCIANVDIRLV